MYEVDGAVGGGVDGEADGFELNGAVVYRGYTIAVLQESNEFGSDGEYRADVFAVDPLGQYLGDHSITHEAFEEDADMWFDFVNTTSDLTQNDEFMAWVKRLVDGRIESEEV